MPCRKWSIPEMVLVKRLMRAPGLVIPGVKLTVWKFKVCRRYGEPNPTPYHAGWWSGYFGCCSVPLNTEHCTFEIFHAKTAPAIVWFQFPELLHFDAPGTRLTTSKFTSIPLK